MSGTKNLPARVDLKISTETVDLGLGDVRLSHVLTAEVKVVLTSPILPSEDAYDVEELSRYVGVRARRGILRSLDDAYTEFIEGTPRRG